MTVRTRWAQVTIQPRDPVTGALIGLPTIVNQLGLAFNQNYVEFDIEKTLGGSDTNKCTLKMYNLNDFQIESCNYIYSQKARRFGSLITVTIGYLETGVFVGFIGVIRYGYTTREGPDYVTYVECQHFSEELKNLEVNYVAAAGTNKAQALLGLVTQAGGVVQAQQVSYINQKLGSQIYEENETISGRLGDLLRDFQKEFNQFIDISFDDVGFSFVKAGDPVFQNPNPPITITKFNGLIGSPRLTPRGFDFDVTLSSNLNINDNIILISEMTTRLSVFGKFSSIILYIQRVSHSGDNREGEFKTSLSTYYPGFFQ